ncbi:hypothetical protein Scep_019093 [Stephania cephalantha]|uniref:Uncharacterized protein n=1 Tax=Stephania cephalantha TaxID=152367 RepID=A0AAP0IA29_9MAGN
MEEGEGVCVVGWQNVPGPICPVLSISVLNGFGQYFCEKHTDARKKEFDDINAEMLKLKIDLNPTTTSGQASNDVEVEDVGGEDELVS